MKIKKKIQKIIQGLNLNRFANNKITTYVLKRKGVLFIKSFYVKKDQF